MNNIDLKNLLVRSAGELSSVINELNGIRKSKITSSDLDEPDYIDMETCYDLSMAAKEIEDGQAACSKTPEPLIYTQPEARIKQLEDAFNEITSLSEYEDCYGIAVAQLDLSTDNEENPLIYTKQMHDAGEQVKVGMECRYKLILTRSSSTTKIVIKYINDQFIVCAKVGAAGEYILQLNDVILLPIDQRTDAEKAFDEWAVNNDNVYATEDVLRLVKAGFVAGYSAVCRKN